MECTKYKKKNQNSKIMTNLSKHNNLITLRYKKSGTLGNCARNGLKSNLTWSDSLFRNSNNYRSLEFEVNFVSKSDLTICMNPGISQKDLLLVIWGQTHNNPSKSWFKATSKRFKKNLEAFFCTGRRETSAMRHFYEIHCAKRRKFMHQSNFMHEFCQMTI